MPILAHLFAAAGDAASQPLSQTINQSGDILKRISDALFNARSLLILLICLLVGGLAGKAVSAILRRISSGFGAQADKASDLPTVNRLRRVETLLILSTALVRIVFVVAALYFWWVYTHPGQQPTALLGASAFIALVAGGVFSPVLRDLAFGGGMMAEHWFGVGDLITIEPFNIQGVVERVTLRSTKVRGLNGEAIWVTNQNIAGARISLKGVHAMALEIFACSDREAARLIEQTNQLLPTGPTMVVSPLTIIKKTERAQGIWHVTAVAEIAPGREWLIEKNALEIMSNLDKKRKKPALLAEPIARYADAGTERRFARAIRNAKKTYSKGRRLSLPTFGLQEHAQTQDLQDVQPQGHDVVRARSQTPNSLAPAAPKPRPPVRKVLQ